jgi:CubicO group peptidase (beta-lactamase class C family)
MLSSRSTTRAFCPAHLSRRELVAGALALAGIAAPDRRVAAQTDAKPGATPGTAGRLSDALLRGFTDDIEQALETFQVPGAAVALVQGREISLARGFGLRDLASGAPVTPRTRFRVGSVTKSMTALLLATFADDGVVGWDDRVVDHWPHFRAPTVELTHTLRLRDLLGMGSGIAESSDLALPVVEFFMMAGDVSARDALRRVADLPVIAAPGAAYSYNN